MENQTKTAAPEKKKIRDIGNVWPCKKCGMYPVWGAFFLLCPGCNFETDYNDPRGHSVRQWNKAMKPTEKKG